MCYTAELVKDKRIGKVVYIVEGEKKELSLLSHIFNKILDYTVLVASREKTPYIKYESKSDTNSKIILISAYQSNIKHIQSESGQEYLDRVFSTLYSEFKIDLSNSAVFYIFDRDNQSNDKIQCEQLISILKNSRDNGMDTNGMLLLSYPCIEAYIKSAIDDTTKSTIESSKKMKIEVSTGKYQYDKINGNEMERACLNMLFTLIDLTDIEWDEKYLDDFASHNKLVFDKQEQVYAKGFYRILSLLSVSFIDLGIIKLKKKAECEF